MRIGHIALWTQDVERLAAFWAETFGAEIGERYESARRPGFVSRFLSLTDGPTIEIMQGPWIGTPEGAVERAGYAHIALSLGSREAVDALATDAARKDILVSPPRMTGDGFYEAVLKDPDGNIIEIMI